MSSGFISEAEITERRKTRQVEWEKVRRPDQPLEAPEEQYDHRTLFERLDEQRKIKELEYEETHKLKNMVKGLDDDEVEFLEMVDRSKMEEEKKLLIEEQKQLRQFRNRVASLEEQDLDTRIDETLMPVKRSSKKNTSMSTQRKLLAGAVVKKMPVENNSSVDHTLAVKTSTESDAIVDNDPVNQISPNKRKLSDDDSSDSNSHSSKKISDGSYSTIPSAAKCVAILPGYYAVTDTSSDSVSSDESSVEDYLFPTKPFRLVSKSNSTELDEE